MDVILYLIYAFIVGGGVALVLGVLYICIAMINDIMTEWGTLYPRILKFFSKKP